MNLDNKIISNKYRITGKIGEGGISEGGISEVYRATDIATGNDRIALKILKKHRTTNRIEDIIRFNAEAALIERLSHPHIVSLIDTGEFSGLHFLTMEYIDGASLASLLLSGAEFPIESAVAVISQVADALAQIHRNRIIHRDLKPGNIMIAGDPAAGTVAAKVIDFGLAQIKEFNEIRDPDEIAGTFSYMAPEQSGVIKRAVDERSDLYSLGIIFYQMLTRTLPYQGDSITALLHQHIAKVPESPASLDPRLPRILDRIVMKLIEKEPERRYQSADGLLHDLERYRLGELDFAVGIGDTHSKLDFRTSLVGREQEITRLTALLDSALKGNGSVCLVGGGAGVGKTRMMEELKERISQHRGLSIGGKCFSGGTKTPYGPFRDALNAYARQYGKYAPERRGVVRQGIREAVGDLGAVIEALNPLMRDLIGESPALVPLEPERENRRFLAVAARFFLALGSIEGGLLLMLDDLQWADGGSIDILSEMAHDIAAHPVMAIGTYRDNEVDPEHALSAFLRRNRESQHTVTSLMLGNFGPEAVTDFIAQILHVPPVNAREIASHVQRQSGGNPFFAIEIVKRMIDDGAIVPHERSWRIVPEKIAAGRIATSMIEVILHRIAQLTPQETSVLSYAALIGRSFKIDLLFALVPDIDTTTIVGIVDRAIGLQLLEEDLNEKGTILFVHDRIREAFNENIPVEERRRLHREIARMLENAEAGDHASGPYDLAYHYIEAGDEDKMLPYALSAGRMAKERYANAEAVRYYTIARGVLERRGGEGLDQWRSCVLNIAEVDVLTGRHDEAIESLTRLLTHQRDKLEKAGSYKLIAEAYFKKGDFNLSEKYSQQGLGLFGEPLPRKTAFVAAGILKECVIQLLHIALPIVFQRKDENPQAHKYDLIIQFFKTLGWEYSLSNTLKSARLILRLLNLSEYRFGPSKQLATAIIGFASMLMFVSLFNAALKYFKKATSMAREKNDLPLVAHSTQLTAYCYAWKGDYQSAISLHSEALSIFRRIGEIREVGITSAGLGEAHLYVSEYAASKKANDDFFEISRKTWDYYGISAALMCSMPYHIQRGEYQRAYDNGNESYRIAQQRNLDFVLCEVSIFIGVLSLEQFDSTQALKYLEQARALYEKNSFLKHYTVALYPYLAEAYLMDFLRNRDARPRTQRKASLKNIGSACRVALRKTRNWTTYYGIAQRVMARYLSAADQWDRADRFFLASIEHHKALGRKYELARSLLEYGLFLNSRGFDSRGRSQLESAYRIFSEIGSSAYIERTASLIGLHKNDDDSRQRLMDRQRLASIIRLSQDVSSVLTIDSLLEIIMAKAIEVTGAQRGYLFIYNTEKRTLELRASRGHEAGGVPEHSQAIVDTVFGEARTIMTANAGMDRRLSDFRSVITRGLKSILCAPLVHQQKVIGVCYLDNPLMSGVFNEEDAGMLDVFMSQAAIAVENANLYNNLERAVDIRTRELRERSREVEEKSIELSRAYEELNGAYSRMKEDLVMARHIQENILPPRLDRVGSLNLYAEYLPLIEVGGDLYDIFERDDGSVRVFLADATGHGIVASLFTMLIKSEYEKLKDAVEDPSELFEILNDIFYVTYKPLKMFFTGILADIDPTRGTLRYAVSGHPSQYLIRGDELIELANTGRPVAIWDEARCETRHLEYRPGDRLLLFTDGLYEEFNRSREEYGEQRLRAAIRANARRPNRELVNALLRDMMVFMDSSKLNDDITIIVIE